MAEFITRFAPSPNGPLHMGHAYSACLASYFAQKFDGTFLLRIEDIDIGRSRAQFEAAIYDDLAWLGLAWPEPVLRQSTRFGLYKSALDQLRHMGLIYPCWATRSEIRHYIENSLVGWRNWPRDPDGAPVYPGLYRDISRHQYQELMWQGNDFAWRLDMEKLHRLAEDRQGGPILIQHLDPLSGLPAHTEEVNARKFGDVIIARKDIPTSYHLSVVIDDAAQNITHIIRGQDLSAATHIHRLLQITLELPAPNYLHHPLIRFEEGRRLSKSAGDAGFRASAYASADDLIAALPPPLGRGDFVVADPA